MMGRNNKGQLRHFLIAILLFSAVITGYYVVMVDVFGFYGTGVGGEFGSFFSYINETVAETTGSDIAELSNKTEGSEGLAQADTPGVTANLFKAILLPYRAVKTVISMISEISKILHIPSWFVTILGSIVTVMVLWWIISAVRGKDI